MTNKKQGYVHVAWDGAPTLAERNNIKVKGKGHLRIYE